MKLRVQNKVWRAPGAKLDPRKLLALRVRLPEAVTVFVPALQRTETCATGAVGVYYGNDVYGVVVRGNEFRYTGDQLVDNVIC